MREPAASGGIRKRDRRAMASRRPVAPLRCPQPIAEHALRLRRDSPQRPPAPPAPRAPPPAPPQKAGAPARPRGRDARHPPPPLVQQRALVEHGARQLIDKDDPAVLPQQEDGGFDIVESFGENRLRRLALI